MRFDLWRPGVSLKAGGRRCSRSWKSTLRRSASTAAPSNAPTIAAGVAAVATGEKTAAATPIVPPEGGGPGPETGTENAREDGRRIEVIEIVNAGLMAATPESLLPGSATACDGSLRSVVVLCELRNAGIMSELVAESPFEMLEIYRESFLVNVGKFVRPAAETAESLFGMFEMPGAVDSSLALVTIA